jgi:uncharacterized membrane protein
MPGYWAFLYAASASIEAPIQRRALEAASIQRARSSSLMWAHAFANVLVLIASMANLKLRWESEQLWVSAGPYLSTFVAALLLISGWLGGSLAYKHGIGVSERVGGGTARSDHDRTVDGRPDISRERQFGA